MKIRVKPQAVKQTKWYEYLIRFIFGGLMTVATGLIAKKFGPVVGGLFLAIPSIFPASITLVQAHKKEEEKKKGKGKALRERLGSQAAGVTAIGSALGCFGLLAFAIVIWQLSTRMLPSLVLLLALIFYLVVAVFAWWARRKIFT